MLKKKLEEVKEMIVKTKNGENKKSIENLVVFIIILIVTILIINMIWNDDKNKDVTNTTYTRLAGKDNDEAENISNINISNEYNLEQQLEDILSKISGVGKVKVLITYSESSKIVPMNNEKYKETQTQENDKNGGTRLIQETDKTVEVVYKESNGQKEIITEKIVMPKIEGALILAQGAQNANVKASLIQAVEALTGLATHKIQVLQMES